MIIDRNKFALIFDKFLNDNNLSSYKVSKETCLSQPTINRYRKNESTPTEINLQILCTIYPKLEKLLSGKELNENELEANQNTTISEDEQELIINNLNPNDMMNRVMNVLEGKEKQLNALIEQQNKLIEQQNKLIDVITTLSNTTSNIGAEKKSAVS